ncbi:flap endonuclease-1 [Candidatus Woesearchaeota archaeon]|nr:flap endonuclease-1 [Candidatus Woesearchaeota archaeon]|tara:strand:+ start:770 stop:1798 length:1029 start_codon:yes stop_codon:yes gene_type:complete
MGTAITELLEPQLISIKDLQGKIVAVDSFNMLYQFLTTIRQRDGTPLKDSKGRITSHLIGLFNRTIKFLQEGVKPVFVFDGKPPALKAKERLRRKELKIEALKQYEQAVEEEDVEEMKKYASRTSRLTPEMVEEAKELLIALGLPVVQAPSEGEAQAAHMVAQGDCYAVVSQDADSLVFGATRVVRNLSVSQRRKKAGTLTYTTVQPELILLSEVLNRLQLSQDQLIIISILVGTDYNYGGVKGIGPKKALQLVRKYPNDFEAIFSEVKWKELWDVGWEEIYTVIKKMPVIDSYRLEWKQIDVEQVVELLVEKHDFSQARVESSLKRFEKEDKEQKGLGEFF